MPAGEGEATINGMATNWSIATAHDGAASPVRDARTPDLMWDAVRTVLRHECGARTFDNWLKPIAFAGIDGDTVRLALPTAFLADWVANHFLDRLRSLWAAQSPGVSHVTLTVVPTSVAAGPSADVTSPAPAAAPVSCIGLEPRYSFDSLSSSASRTSSLITPRERWPRVGRSASTRCFSTAPPGSARRI